MNKHRPLALLLLTALLAGCQTPTTPESGPRIAPLPADSFKRQWATNLDLTGGDALTSLYLRQDLVFAYSRNHDVFQIQRNNGLLAKIYRPARPALALHPPVLSGKYLVFPTTLTIEVYERTGRKVKTINMADNISSPATGDANRIVLGVDHVGGGRIQEIDLENEYNAVGWQVMTYGRVSATPAISRGYVFAVSQDGKVYAMLLESGRAVWSGAGTFSTNGPIIADLVVEEQALYVASTDGRLYALNPSTMQLQWQYFAGRELTTAPVVTASTVYQPVPGQGIVALNKGTVPADKAAVTAFAYNRQPRWANKQIKQVLSEDERYVYAAARDNAIVALDKATGQEKFRSRRTDFSIFVSNPKDVTIYAASADGLVIAVTPVLKAGQVGELVLDLRPLGPLAAAE